jgi:predicted GH43/DUF377 family glycosyl hydrolase
MNASAPLYPVEYLKNDRFNPNIQIDDRVRIINSADPVLEDKKGYVRGVVSLHLMVCWIVELDDKITVGFGFAVKCVSIPSMCLERI